MCCLYFERQNLTNCESLVLVNWTHLDGSFSGYSRFTFFVQICMVRFSWILWKILWDQCCIGTKPAISWLLIYSSKCPTPTPLLSIPCITFLWLNRTKFYNNGDKIICMLKGKVITKLLQSQKLTIPKKQKLNCPSKSRNCLAWKSRCLFERP